MPAPYTCCTHSRPSSRTLIFTLLARPSGPADRNTGTEIARDPALAALLPPVGVWFDFSVQVNNLWSFAASIGNTTVWSGTDPGASGPTWGSAGMYADGQVAFRNFSVTGSCDGGGNCA